MADLTVSTPLKQWTFEKPALVRPERSGSSASSPDLYHNDGETLRIAASAPVDDAMSLDTKDTISFQERYMSSEEDLSPNEGDSDSDFDDDVSIHEPEKEYLHARKISIAKFDKGKSCDMAVVVSIVSAGRPKMIELANLGSQPFPKSTQRSQRSASLAQLPTAVIEKLREVEQSPRLSLAVSPTSSSLLTSRSVSPATSMQPARLTPSPVPSQKDASLRSSSSSFTGSSTRSSSPWAREKSTQPSTGDSTPNTSPWASSRRPATAANPPIRSTLSVSTAPPKTQPRPTAPLTPPSPEPHAFLSSDPYETSTVSSASPIIKSSPHKRLRSISQKLALAKIAISPSTKKWDSRVNGKGVTSPPMPLTPFTPHTPQTTPSTSFSASTYKLRRNSKVSRPNSRIGTPMTPDVPPLPSTIPDSRSRMQKMVPRGANEREPMMELPPFPSQDAEGDPASTLKARRVRKRRSLMDLL